VCGYPSPYAAPAWVERHGARVDAATPRAALLNHHTLPDGWEQWFAFEQIGTSPGRDGPRFEIISMALNAAVAGLGVVLLPAYMAQDMVQAGRLQRLSPRVWRYAKGYYLVYPEESGRLPALQTFRAWLLGLARE
jgi:LysR family glycine cleavage system transcriptional activator